MSNKLVRSAVVMAFLAVSALSNVAFAIYEVEPNDSISTPQRLVVGSGGIVEVTGSIGDPLGTTIVNDVDFYSFEGQEGDVVTVDIDGGVKMPGTGRSVDTFLTLFRPDLTIERAADFGLIPPDEGSVSPRDALLVNVRLPVTGTYTVAVSDGSIAGSNGSYTLIISGVTPAPSAQQINIVVKPGDREISTLNPKSKGNIPVALLSSSEFDALAVDRASITFGATGDEDSLRRCNKEGFDVDGDGRLDLVCHFENQSAGFEFGDLEGIVKGRTAAGAFEGRGFLKVLPSKQDSRAGKRK